MVEVLSRKFSDSIVEPQPGVINPNSVPETTLPSFDGKPLLKPKSKSTDRHSRERLAIIAQNALMKETTFRRYVFIMIHGSPEIQQLVIDKKVSIWRAYNFVNRKLIADITRALKAAGEL
jgi:hypothetical protein